MSATMPPNTAAGFPSAKSRFDSGFAAGARVGYEMGPWRFEEEYTYRRNGLDRITAAGFTPAGTKGHRESHAIMTNVLYDINLAALGLGPALPVTPHIGADFVHWQPPEGGDRALGLVDFAIGCGSRCM